MIVVKLWGGLGNQMFQYAFATYLAKQRNESNKFFTDGLTNDVHNLGLKSFSLDLVALNDKEKASLGYGFKSHLEYRIKRKLLQLFPFLNKKIVIEKGLEYKSNISKNAELFDGYWQSYKYTDAVEIELREKFVFNDSKLEQLNDYAEIASSNSVSLHIRKGDYLAGKNALIYEECSMDYYLNGMAEIKKNVVSPVFFVFSNDLKWAKEHLIVSNSINIRFVDNSCYKDPSIADLFLMSQCKHNIIANSTFSWWGAWLNSFNNKIIIAPAKWYVGELNKSTVDLIPTNWIRI